MSLTKSRPLSPLSFSSVPEDADSCWKFRPASDFKHSILIEDWEQNSIKHSLRGLTVVERWRRVLPRGRIRLALRTPKCRARVDALFP